MDEAGPVIERLCRRAGLPTRGLRIAPLRRGASGSKVFEVTLKERRLVAKLGAAPKIEAEAAACRRWETLSPGSARPILAEEADGERRALLGAYLGGATITELWERDGMTPTIPVVDVLALTMRAIWDGTVVQRPAPSAYADEIRARLYALIEARPALAPLVERHAAGAPSGRELLWRLQEVERDLRPSFSVMTHGDLTPDNVLFEPDTGLIAFLDLARSGPGDYLLDVGKFVAAEMRRKRRSGRPRLSAPLIAAARAFGRERGDPHIEERLSISCARTLLGSARLVDDDKARWQIETGLSMLAHGLGAG